MQAQVTGGCPRGAPGDWSSVVRAEVENRRDHVRRELTAKARAFM